MGLDRLRLAACAVLGVNPWSFGQMRPRDFEVMCRAYRWQFKRRQEEQERQTKEHATLAALVTAELVNIFAAPYASKKWKPVKPSDYLRAWIGQPPGDEAGLFAKKDPNADLRAAWESLNMEVEHGD